MADKTGISWTDATWNPIVGCSRCSPGCDNCYAIGVAHRGLAAQHRGLTIRSDRGLDWTGEIRYVPEVLDKPMRWRRPRHIFVNSLSDLFHPDLAVEVVAKVFAVMALAQRHRFQVLTKRARNLRRLLTSSSFWQLVSVEIRALADDPERLRDAVDLAGSGVLPNVWLGVSIEADRYAFRADHLRAAPAAIRFVSAEPLLGPLPSLNLTGIDWLIVGGESGPGARAMDLDWARDLCRRCKTCSCGHHSGDHYVDALGCVEGLCTCHEPFGQRTAFFFKQVGGLRSTSGGDLLDGQEHKEMPELISPGSQQGATT